MNNVRVGVLRGGPSAEYDVSLKTGQAVLAALPEDRYEVRDIFVDRSGQWHQRGMPVEPLQLFNQIDVFFNALHGSYGEDGTIQELFDTHRVRYTGSSRLGSVVAMNKPLAKHVLRDRGLLHAAHRVVHAHEYTNALVGELWRTQMQPSVVKPAWGGSSVATAIARTPQELGEAIERALEEGDTVLVEQYMQGREVTVAVAEGYRGEELYAFPPIEIIPTKTDFFDYDEKYAGHAKEVCPANLGHERTQQLLEFARDVHRTLHLRDYSRSDFIIGPDGVYFLEVNTLPGLTEQSLVPQALRAVGGTLPDFLTHIVERAATRV